MVADYNILIGSRGYLHVARESPQIATETEEDEEEEEYDWGDWVQSINGVVGCRNGVVGCRGRQNATPEKTVGLATVI